MGFFGINVANATDTTNTPTSTVTVGNSAPTVSGIKLNNNSDIILTVNATTAVVLNYTVADNNGCSDINTNAMTSTLFVASSSPFVVCNSTYPTTSSVYCYLYSSRTTSSCSGSSYNVSDTFWLYYYAAGTGNASATDGSSSFWDAHIVAVDKSLATGDGTSSNQNVTTLIGLTVTTSTINYGTMAGGATSSVANILTQIATTTNAGNATTSLKLSSLIDLYSSGTGQVISSTYQHYSTSSFTYGGNEQQLQGSSTPQLVTGLTLWVVTSTASGASSSKATWWGLQAPSVATGTYNGLVTFSSVWTGTQQ